MNKKEIKNTKTKKTKKLECQKGWWSDKTKACAKWLNILAPPSRWHEITVFKRLYLSRWYNIPARLINALVMRQMRPKKPFLTLCTYIIYNKTPNISVTRPCRTYIAYFKLQETRNASRLINRPSPFVVPCYYAVVSRFFIYKFLWFFLFFL